MKKQNRCIHKILRDFKILSLVDHTTNVLYYIYQSEKLYQSTNHLILVTLIFHHNFHNKPPHNNTLSVSLRFFVLFRALFTLCTLSLFLFLSTCEKISLLLLFTRPLPRDGCMAEDHGAPEAGQLPRVWARGSKETESRQRVSGAKSP